MFFSVIIPFFNSEKTLQNTLNSLKKQKKNYELILVNDGSVDNSNQIVNKHKVFFKCIKIFNYLCFFLKKLIFIVEKYFIFY
jgi:glycosyltransferase involved in cell wall biosynthesis